jgi:hypothetical protein
MLEINVEYYEIGSLVPFVEPNKNLLTSLMSYLVYIEEYDEEEMVDSYFLSDPRCCYAISYDPFQDDKMIYSLS